MFVAYADESGYVGCRPNLQQPVQAFAAVIPNAIRLHKTSAQFQQILEILRDHGIALQELKAEQIYRGRGPWRHVEGRIRHRVFETYLEWLTERKHKITLSLIDNQRFFDLKASEHPIALELDAPYVAGALHLALSIQRCHQRQKRNKGKTVLILDEQQEYQDKVAALLARPPQFSDPYYGYNSRRRERLDQIVDTAYYGCSHYSILVQVADTIAFIARLQAELTSYEEPEAYQGEAARVAIWFEVIHRRLLPRGCLYPRLNVPIVRFFREIAPPSLPF